MLRLIPCCVGNGCYTSTCVAGGLRGIRSSFHGRVLLARCRLMPTLGLLASRLHHKLKMAVGIVVEPSYNFGPFLGHVVEMGYNLLLLGGGRVVGGH